MFNLSNIGPRTGAKRKRKRIGRGAGSGWGKTSGRGHKGQGARKSGNVRPGFEGGQTPLYRRTPKRGFKNPFRVEYTGVNLTALAGAAQGDVIDQDWLRSHGQVPKDVKDGVKLLGVGEIKVAVTVRVQAISEAARRKIEAAGGTVEVG
jgi:large subunit ribosomal protein L15